MRLSNHYIGKRIKMMRSYRTDVVLDVGANTGQFATRLRNLGYSGEIASFEPMQVAYDELLKTSSQDPSWNCHNFALGEEECELKINVSNNSISSSILSMLPEHEKHSPASRVVADEVIRVKRLDQLPEWQQWRQKNGVWLKIDVQGYENYVLSGASDCLNDIAAIQLELSLRPLYAGQLTIAPMIERLASLGFDPVSFEPGFCDKISGEYLQVDGIFRNRRMR
jgi:FkbM family methyltransferase